MSGSSFVTYWYLHGPNLLLLALVFLLLGRLVVSFVAGNSAVMRFLAAMTHPVTVAVGAVTPRIVPPRMIIVFAITWLVAVRATLSMVALAMGVRL